METFRGGVVAVYKDIQYFGLNKFNTRLHKSMFRQKMNCQKKKWDQARFSSLVQRFE